jgi:hypothetical protein
MGEKKMFNSDAYKEFLDCFFSQKNLSFVNVVFGQSTSLSTKLAGEKVDDVALSSIRSVLETNPDVSFYWRIAFKMNDGLCGRIHFEPSGRSANVYLCGDGGKELRTSVVHMEKNSTNEIFVEISDRFRGREVTKKLNCAFDLDEWVD